MKKIYFIVLTIATIVAATKATPAQTTDDVLNLLVNKNMIAQQDADSLRAEFAIKQQEAKEKQKLFNVSAKRSIQVSGYTQFRFQSLQEAGKNDGLDVRRARLDFKGALTPIWDYRLQLDFASSPKIVDALIIYKPFDYFKVQAGQFKIPFSLANLTQSSQLEIIERPQVVEALVARGRDVIGNQNGRDIGLQMFGSVAKINDRFLIDYFVAALNGAGINTVETNENKDIVGRLVMHPVNGLDIGGSIYSGFNRIGDPNEKSQKRNRMGAEISYIWKNLTLKGEYIQGEDKAVKKEGYYAQALYFIFPKKLQIAFSYDSFDVDKDKEENISIWHTGGLTYFFNEWAKLSVNYSNKTEEGKKINNDVISAQAQINF